ncbi:hypothetical protein SteCoe_30000 [Stentor coeruleus]|uniref:Uncharacterized protein n=1 Tax=Stentor coeruleus TaxID=5963 RepID=A0A1R2B4K1_9CILI|nr:hypothetical protein SteCoe_30000 [Stentor coeruleus]
MKNSGLTYYSCETTPKTSPKSSPRVTNPLTYFIVPKRIIKGEVKSEVSSPIDKNRKLLNKICNRVITSNESVVSPETAVKVVKKYILPMFEGDKRVKAEAGRSSVQSNRRKFSQDQSTVYGELKLSVKLAKELEDITVKLAKMEQQMNEKIQDKEILVKENTFLKQELQNTQINLEVYLNENQKMRRELSRMSFSTNFATGQLCKMKNLYEDISKHMESAMKELNEERLSNDIRFL